MVNLYDNNSGIVPARNKAVVKKPDYSLLTQQELETGIAIREQNLQLNNTLGHLSQTFINLNECSRLGREVDRLSSKVYGTDFNESAYLTDTELDGNKQTMQNAHDYYYEQSLAALHEKQAMEWALRTKSNN